MGFGRLRGKSVISELGGREQKQKFYQTNDSNGLNMFTGGNVFLSYFFSFFQQPTSPVLITTAPVILMMSVVYPFSICLVQQL